MSPVRKPVSRPKKIAASEAAAFSARAVHREQVWAALIRAVEFLLEDALDQVERDRDRAQRNGDEAGTDRLMGRERVLKSLRREVSSPPP